MVYRSRFFLVAALGAVLGCNESKSLPTVPVTGTITMGGAPVEGATVSFLPKAPTAETKPATGQTDAQGHYELATYLNSKESPKGALPGEYNVTIVKLASGATPTEPGGMGNLTDPAMLEKMNQQMVEQQKGVAGTGAQGADVAQKRGPGMYGQAASESLLPARYSKPDSSGLEASVKDGETNNYDFPLSE